MVVIIKFLKKVAINMESKLVAQLMKIDEGYN